MDFIYGEYHFDFNHTLTLSDIIKSFDEYVRDYWIKDELLNWIGEKYAKEYFKKRKKEPDKS